MSKGAFFLIFFLSNFASADQWTCVAMADLTGDPSSYWINTKDAWKGPGVIECMSGRRILQIETKVSFESRNEGRGANINSRIAFESWPVVTRAPSTLAQKDLKVQQGTGGMTDSWISVDSKVNMNFLIYGNQLDRYAESIRSGKLNISVEKERP